MAWKRFVIAGDIHGDKQDPAAIAAFFRFQEQWKPELRILNGDCWDMRPLRRGASEDERHESMVADIEAGNTFIQRFRPTHFNRGNHDERLWDLAKYGKGVLGDYASRGAYEIEELLSKLKCTMLPYDKRAGVYRLGHLKVLHGFGGAATSAARKHASVYGSCIVNHFHCIQQASIEGIDNRIGRVIGCLCLLDMDYNRAHLGSLMHRHGWTYGIVNPKTSNYHIWQAEQVDGLWMLPSDIVSI